MDDTAEKIISILKKNMKSQPETEINESTQLADLDIESLDLAVIVFDIEDAFGIEIPFDASENADDFKTIGSIVESVKKMQAEKDGASA